MTVQGWLIVAMILAIPLQVIPAYFYLQAFPIGRDHLIGTILVGLMWVLFALWFINGIPGLLLSIGVVGIFGPVVFRTWKSLREAP
jgi:hypothetical protein